MLFERVDTLMEMTRQGLALLSRLGDLVDVPKGNRVIIRLPVRFMLVI